MDSAEFGRLRDSSALLSEPTALKRRLEQDGYLYLKNFLDRDAVLQARSAILEHMAQHEGIEPGSRPLDGVMGQYGKSVTMQGRSMITHHSAVKAVLESSRLFDLHRRIQDEPVVTFSYKWLRAVGHEEATGCHMDHVYMGRGSDRVMTTWVPFGDLAIGQGTLAICEGSHRSEGYARLRQTYGRMDVDRDGIEGWFSMHPREVTETFGGRWLTDDVQAGDLIVFGMHLMHASTTNTTDRWRLSCDVRFQPAADTVDERWAGELPRGHDTPSGQSTATKSMAQARAEWGL